MPRSACPPKSILPKVSDEVIKKIGIWTAVGLGNTERGKGRWETYKAIMRKYMPLYLEMRLTVRKQKPRMWRKYNDRICEECPFFNTFVDRWPIKYYVERYLWSARSKMKQSAGRHRANQESLVYARLEPGATMVKPSARRGKQETFHSTTHMLRKGHSPVTPLPDGDAVMVVDHPLPPKRTTRYICEVVMPPRPRHPNSKPPSSPESTPSFQALMESTDSVLGKHCARFIEAGISSVDHLRAFVAFPRAEKVLFIVDYCGPLLPFEVAQIIVALQGEKVLELIYQ